MIDLGIPIAVIGIGLAFVIGWSVGQASSCAVTAAKEIVHYRSARLLTGFILAGGLAGLISLPVAWTLGMRAGLPPEAPLGLTLVIGATLLATGALVNDACLFGSLARISQGEVRFLAVPVGLFIGYAGASTFAPAGQPLTPNAFSTPSPAAIVLVSVSAFLVPLSLWLLRKTPRPPDAWPLQWSMVLLGGAGSLLFVLTPGWTYSDGIRHAALAVTGHRQHEAMLSVVLAGLATIAGAIAAGWWAGRFRLREPETGPVLRSIAGGALMAVGAWFVPGGNDNLLLWAVPGGSVSGLIAYIIMSGTILLFLFARRYEVGPALLIRAFGRR